MKKLFILLLLVSACKKAEDRRCWKFNGDPVEKIVSLENFNEVEIRSHLIVNLIQDTVNFAVVKGGENVVNLITTEIEQGKLVLSNTNKCNYLRSGKKKITIDIHFVSLDKIIYHGSEPLKSIGVISGSQLTIEIKETAGTIILEVNTLNFYLNAEPSWANFVISGSTKNASFSVKGNAYGDARELHVENKVLCCSRTVGDIYINGDVSLLKCETNGSGNVYFTNTPGNIEWNNYGTGKLLQAP